MAEQPFPHYTRKGKLSSSELKAFRSRVSELKKQGLVKSTVKVGSARPYQLSGDKTLAEIVNKSYEPKLARAGSPLTITDLRKAIPSLPEKEFSTMSSTLNYLEAHADEIDKLKRPEDYFAFQIDTSRGVADSMIPFRDIGSMMAEINKYRNVPGHAFNKRFGSAHNNITGPIKIVRFTGTAKQYVNTRKFRPVKHNPKKAAKQAERRRKKKGGSK